MQSPFLLPLHPVPLPSLSPMLCGLLSTHRPHARPSTILGLLLPSSVFLSKSILRAKHSAAFDLM